MLYILQTTCIINKNSIVDTPTLPCNDDEIMDEIPEEVPESSNGLYTIALKVKGGTYEPCQTNIIKLRELGVDRLQQVVLKLEKEVCNKVDKNAVLVLAHCGEWLKLGYIGVNHLKRISKGWESIVNVTTSSITRKYESKVSKFIYYCHIVITKRGKWLAQNPSQMYNSDL